MFFNAVIFDLDNTLYDYNICHNTALKTVAEHLKIDNFNKVYSLVINKFKDEMGNVAASHNRFIYFKWIKEYLDADFSVEEINNLYWEVYFSNMILFDGVIDLLKFLKENKIKMAILTDFLTEYQYKKLSKLG